MSAQVGKKNGEKKRGKEKRKRKVEKKKWKKKKKIEKKTRQMFAVYLAMCLSILTFTWDVHWCV